MGYPHRRRLVTLLDVGVMASGSVEPILPILDGLGVWYKADDGASSSFAAQFTAANSESLSIASNSTLQLGNIPWTIGGWIYADSLSGTANVLLSKRGPAATTLDYQLYIASVGAFLASHNGTSYAITPAAPITTGAWHFLVGFYDPAVAG